MGEETLTDRVAQLTRALPWIGPELKAALDKATSDRKESLSKSRLVLEKIVKELAVYEGVEPKGRTPGQILEDKKIKQLPPVEIYCEMRYVYAVASEYGSHVGEPRAEIAITALNRLCQIVDWYTTEYMGSGLVDNFGKPIDRDDKLVLYVSSGGTDRCA